MMRQGETLEGWRQRMADKAAHQRAFLDRDETATLGQLKVRKIKPRPKTPRSVASSVSRRMAADPKSPGRHPLPPGHCTGCGVEVYRNSSNLDRPEGAKRLVARGLCTTCYPRAKKEGRL